MSAFGGVDSRGGVPTDSQNPNAPAVPPYGVPPLPRVPDNLSLPDPKTGFHQFRAELKEFLTRLKYLFLLPLSWFITFLHFGKKILKQLILLPFTIFINIYERKVRAAFPALPSIWGILFTLFPSGIKLPSLTGFVTGIYKGPGPVGTIPEMSIDFDSIVNGGANGVNDAVAAASQSAQDAVNGAADGLHSHLDNVLSNVKGLPVSAIQNGVHELQNKTERVENTLKKALGGGGTPNGA